MLVVRQTSVQNNTKKLCNRLRGDISPVETDSTIRIVAAAAAKRGFGLSCRSDGAAEGANGFETSQSANVQSTPTAIWAPICAPSLTRKQNGQREIMRRQRGVA